MSLKSLEDKLLVNTYLKKSMKKVCKRQKLKTEILSFFILIYIHQIYILMMHKS